MGGGISYILSKLDTADAREKLIQTLTPKLTSFIVKYVDIIHLCYPEDVKDMTLKSFLSTTMALLITWTLLW